MINKEQFKDIIKHIQQQEEKERKLCKDLEVFFDGNFVSCVSEDLLEALLNVLKFVFNDLSDDWIGWWLYDTTDKKYTDKDIEHDVNDIDDFYDFLIQNMKDKDGD